MTTLVMTFLWLSQRTTGLAGTGMGSHLRQQRMLAAIEQQPAVKSPVKQTVSTGARTGLAEQGLSASKGGGAWCGLHTWGSRLWQWLGGSRRGPLYRWQEREEEDVHGLERDDTGSGLGARKRRLREATIPHIIHQVLIFACSTGSGICLLFHGVLCLLLAFGGSRRHTSRRQNQGRDFHVQCPGVLGWGGSIRRGGEEGGAGRQGVQEIQSQVMLAMQMPTRKACGRVFLPAPICICLIRGGSRRIDGHLPEDSHTQNCTPALAQCLWLSHILAASVKYTRKTAALH